VAPIPQGDENVPGRLGHVADDAEVDRPVGADCVDVAVDLPASTAEPQPRPDKPIYLTVKADLSLALGDDPVPRDTLGQALDTATRGHKDERIFLRSDRAVPYGDVMEVMNMLRGAGYLKIALVGLEIRDGK